MGLFDTSLITKTKEEEEKKKVEKKSMFDLSPITKAQEFDAQLKQVRETYVPPIKPVTTSNRLIGAGALDLAPSPIYKEQVQPIQTTGLDVLKPKSTSMFFGNPMAETKEEQNAKLMQNPTAYRGLAGLTLTTGNLDQETLKRAREQEKPLFDYSKPAYEKTIGGSQFLPETKLNVPEKKGFITPSDIAQTTGSIANVGLSYGGMGQVVSKIPALANITNPALREFATELAKDLLYTTGTTSFEGLTRGQTVGEIAKEIPQNLAIDAVMNLGFLGASKIFKSLGYADDVVSKVVKDADIEIKANPNFYVNKQGVADTKPFNQLQLPSPNQISFEDWRKQNFGGAFGKMSDEDMKALRDLYVEDVQMPKVKNVERPFTLTQAEKMQLPRLESQLKPKTIAENIQQPKTIGPTLREAIPEANLPSTKKPVYNISDVIVQAPKYKDLGTFEPYTTDVYRNFKKVFGQDYDTVKKSLLDPFDNAKKLRVEDEIRLTDDLKKTIVDDLGISKNTKEAELTMVYGEGRIDYDGLVKEVGEAKATKIVQADKWFRNQYDTLLDEINVARISQGATPIPKRSDYYRHAQEFGESFEAIKNLFESPKMISSNLVGISEFTKPKKKWASIEQKRLDGMNFKEDAIFAFLDYIKAATYAKHIDPQLAKFREFENQIGNATLGTGNLNNFKGFLNEFNNSLAGKTNAFDRTIQDKVLGRKVFSILNAASTRMKKNAVVGNLSSSLSQIANVPQGLAYVKDPKILAEGMDGFFKSLSGKGDSLLYEKSGFLKERFTDSFSQFDTRIIDQPLKVASWALGALDEVGTKYIWSSVYRKGLKEGVENVVKYADDVTRELVAGRGIGEVPIVQQSKVFQLLAPFTLEVNNLWKVQKDFLNKKDFSALAILYLSNFALNGAMEEIRGSGVVFDPIKAVLEGAKTEGDLKDKAIGVLGSLGGEIISNKPLGSTIGAAYPEYGGSIGNLELPTRSELFGVNDPTRYGTGLPLLKAAQDPLKNFVLPFGGSQISKTIAGAKTLGLLPQKVSVKNTKVGKDLPNQVLENKNLPASVNKSGKLRTFIEPTTPKILQALAFGGYASKEVREYFENEGSVYGETQTANIMKLVDDGFEPIKLDKALTQTRKTTKKDEKIAILQKNGYTKNEIEKISKTFWGIQND